MKKLYAILDRIANELVGLRMYTIMCFRTDEEAARYFSDAINDTSSILNKHPSDYTLVRLGQIDDLGNITATKPELVITGDTLLALQQPALVKEA